MKHIPILLILITCFNISHAQKKGDAGEYLTAIADEQVEMNAKYLQYMSTPAQELKQRNVEILRRELLETITNTQIKTTGLAPYAGDNNLRQKSIDYIQKCYNIFINDFGKILNPKDTTEQSFNDMQAMVLVQEKAFEKLIQASLAMTNATLDFAKKYKVRFNSPPDSLTEKLTQAARLNKYRNEVFLIFYKCNWEDIQISKAIEAKKVNDIEQRRLALLQYAVNGLKQLERMKNYEGDPSLKHACKEVLEFYMKIAQYDIPQLAEFYIAEENFNKRKKDFEKTLKHTKEQVYSYNTEVKNHNAAVTRYHRVNNFITNNRRLILSNWNARQKIFADTHMPHYKEKDVKKVTSVR